MTNNRTVFVSAIAADPYDAVTRKVFADWLDENDEPEEADRQRSWTREKYDEAKQWLRDFSERHDIPYDDVIMAGHTGEYTQFGSQSARDDMYDDREREEFWRHWGMVADVLVSQEKRENTVFSCSC